MQNIKNYGVPQFSMSQLSVVIEELFYLWKMFKKNFIMEDR